MHVCLSELGEESSGHCWVGGSCPLESILASGFLCHVTDNPSKFSWLCLPMATDVAAIVALFPALLSPHVPLR